MNTFFRWTLGLGVIAVAGSATAQGSLGQTDTLNGRGNLVIRFDPTLAGVNYPVTDASFGYDGQTLGSSGAPVTPGATANVFGLDAPFVTWDSVDTFSVRPSTSIQVMPFVWIQGAFERFVYVQGVGSGSQSDDQDVAILTNVELTFSADGADFDLVGANTPAVGALELDYRFSFFDDSVSRSGGSLGSGFGIPRTITIDAATGVGTGTLVQVLDPATNTTQGWATLRLSRELRVDPTNGVLAPGSYTSEGQLDIQLSL